jgi:hypothetical protein
MAANQRNAKKSCGPKTALGKMNSRENAVRHGLTGETVVAVLEDRDEYMKFETAVVADYAPLSTLERALVTRIASILWRLRRATAVETGLLQIQAGILRDRKADRDTPGMSVLYSILRQSVMTERSITTDLALHAKPDRTIELALSFVRLTNFDSAAFERLSRYETHLLRQLTRILLALRTLKAL